VHIVCEMMFGCLSVAGTNGCLKAEC